LSTRGQHSVTRGDAAVRRRVGWIWALLFLNVLEWTKSPLIIAIPSRVGQGIAQGALWLAFLLALTVNPRVLLRRNLFLILCTALAATSLIVSVRTLHLGSSYRAVRLIGFIATLWLLTPWFGRRDLLLLRCHLRCLMGVIVITFAGAMVSPGKAFQGSRLSGVVWPIPPTQVAHYAAIAVGIGVVLWLSGLLRRKAALTVTGFGLLILLLTHTRTALIALIVGILIAAASLFIARRRARRALALSLLMIALAGAIAFPSITQWFLRGESATIFTQLDGRTTVWHELTNAPRSETQMVFGFGLSNSSFQGRAIDNSWLAVYQDQGLIGDVLIGLFLLALLVTALIRPPGAYRALALFLVTYCIFASYTEVGLGNASPYLLDLTVAASVVMLPRVSSGLSSTSEPGF